MERRKLLNLSKRRMLGTVGFPYSLKNPKFMPELRALKGKSNKKTTTFGYYQGFGLRKSYSATAAACGRK